MPIDPFSTETLTRNAPPRNAMEVTPSDTQDLLVLPTGIWAEKADGGPISLRVQMGTGDPVTLTLPGTTTSPSVIAGFGISPTRIYATGTTASRVILFW